ncbi:MAG: fatty acid--CoA ligase [Gammaproteobacteria bacterium]|nr:fatty acid--CoA ligase [Gammaproteobacteria bacterium]MDH3449614.1 fatty acid--CoA ligase [Gammaproteobacteria bacterium]
MKATHASSAYAYPLLIGQLWHTPISCTPDQEIVGGAERRFSYRELRARIGQLASGLNSIGVQPGDTVAVMDWDSHRYLECFFAVPMMAAVLHTINVRLSPQQILYTINHAQDDVILLHADFVPIIEQISDRIESGARFVFLRDSPDTPVPDFCEHEYEALLQAGSTDFEFDDFDENTVATTFYTTGTTGDPKAVFYSHRQLVLHTLGLVGGLASTDSSSRVHRGDVYMPITPMFHVHAWGFPYAATLLGIKQVYPGRYDPAQLLRLIAEEGVTFSHCVPTILHMLLTAPGAGQVDLSRWKVVIGGSALPLGLAQAATQRGINLFAAYGMSETCPFLTAADMTGVHAVDPEGDPAARCKTGKPTLMVELRVVDADLNDIPRGGAVTGEVVVRAPWLTQGYAGNPEGSEALWEGGYLHTGDVGFIDAGGSLQITDRIKDVIKSGGEWISSLQLEDLVSVCASVTEVAAIGIPSRRWGERPLLAIVGSPGADQDAVVGEVRASIQSGIDAGQISKWAMPERIELLDTLPKTSVGKMDKKALRARFADAG